jgi:hypothetical protein
MNNHPWTEIRCNGRKRSSISASGTRAFLLTNCGEENLRNSVCQLQREFSNHVYKLSVPSLSYGSEVWTLKQRDIRRLKTAEIIFMRTTAGYSLLDHRRNEDILRELKVEPAKRN